MDPGTTANTDAPAVATPVVEHGGSIASGLKAFPLIGGDWVLWVLIFASILSVTVIIERFIYFFRNRTPVDRFIEAFTERLGRDDVTGAIALADITKGAEARVAKVGLNHFEQ